MTVGAGYRTVNVVGFEGDGVTVDGDPFLRVRVHPGGIWRCFKPPEDLEAFLHKAADALPARAVRLLIEQHRDRDGKKWVKIIGYEHPGQTIIPGCAEPAGKQLGAGR